MSALYSVAEILSATGGRVEAVSAEAVSSISIDSREIEPGALFVAIKGERFDGHDFVAAAIANGAVAALVCEDKLDTFPDLPLIIVPDALEGLIALARAARARSNAKIIAVTGSVGKTTTKEAIRVVLSAHGKTHASIKSFNNHWGVPLMLARMPRDTAFGVFEIGMSAAAEITPLAQLVQPDIAVITMIAPAHLENFGSLEGIALAKAEIFDGMDANGCAIINVDHDCFDILSAAAMRTGVEHIVRYGFGGNADVRIVDAGLGVAGMRARVIWPNDSEQLLEIASLGRHQLANAVAALCVAREVGIDMSMAVAVLVDLKEPDGRGAILRLGSAEKPLVVIDESYNANPASMAVALETFAAFNAPDGQKMLVLGDMLELGSVSNNLHEELKNSVVTSGVKKVFLIGSRMKALLHALGDEIDVTHAEMLGEIDDLVLGSLDYGDAIMVKGSNGMQLNSLVSRIRERFGAVVTAE